jgi:hypothetical protein
MAKGVALTIGLNSVDPNHYQGWSGELVACENDARDMAEIARSGGFDVSTLLTRKATREAVLGTISKAASSLRAGDIFMLTYSGHGGQLPDLNGDEPDGLDETWCLFDGELVDDELYQFLGKFSQGVRILVFSDSCHSGTVVKAAYYGAKPQTLAASHEFGESGRPVRYRAMPNAVAMRVYQANKNMYDPILLDVGLKNAMANIKVSVLLISGCQDNQLSADGAFNGLFTGTLRRVWNGGKFKENYKQFHKAIVAQMPPDQTPNYFTVGASNTQFEIQAVFTI